MKAEYPLLFALQPSKYRLICARCGVYSMEVGAPPESPDAERLETEQGWVWREGEGALCGGCARGASPKWKEGPLPEDATPGSRWWIHWKTRPGWDEFIELDEHILNGSAWAFFRAEISEYKEG